MKIDLWKDGEFTDSANKAMFIASFVLGIIGMVVGAII